MSWSKDDFSPQERKLAWNVPGTIGYCWCCGDIDDPKRVPLVADPMSPPEDRVGICLSCRERRLEVVKVYVASGTHLVPHRPPTP